MPAIIGRQLTAVKDNCTVLLFSVFQWCVDIGQYHWRLEIKYDDPGDTLYPEIEVGSFVSGSFGSFSEL